MTAICGKGASFWRVTISPKRADLDATGAAVLRDVHDLGLSHVRQVAASRLFLLEGPLTAAQVERIAGELLVDPITEAYGYQPGGNDRTLPGDGFDAVIEVHLKGGVMDPVAASTLMAIADMGIDTTGLAVATARLYRAAGLKTIDEAEFIARRLLSNDCIEDVHLTGFGRHDERSDHLPIAPTRPFELRHVPIRKLDDQALAALSRDAHLFLSLTEMRTIQDYYRSLDRDPTDLELEMIAQTWSEHCVHKTLKSQVVYEGAPLPAGSAARQQSAGNGTVRLEYGNLLKETIARATYELMQTGRADWCLSVFVDNAGVIALDDDYGIAFKVETHNHPSAIEPYGGAATGIGGVIRDVLGCGLGAKPIANTDVFCFAPPDFPMDLLPKGVLHPRRVFKGVVAGVRDYGNRMGIPTVNGAILFDDRYLGNPLVFCGCIGLIPRNCIQKEPRPGDLVVVIGGRTGRDGIHGATFSSAELTDTHADEFSHAVQIGDAITEKKVLDALLKARDFDGKCLYTAVTDCGAGGLSSAVGEMGQKLGAEVELDKVPLKYAGLRYDEIWISEAQERMVFAVPPGNWDAFRRICEAESVETTVIGTFHNDGQLIVRYAGQIVGRMDMKFLHEGLAKTQKKATWQPPDGGAEVDYRNEPRAEHRPPSGGARAVSPADIREELLHRLSRFNTASKEWVIRQYDHEVQGGSVVKPLVGPGLGPSDGAVIRPRLGSKKGLAIANGINTALADVDPYWMAVAGIDEAIRNIVCIGGNPDRTAILDNFCWGSCEDPQTMGALVRACQACYDAAIAYGTPFISGKDSLNNEFALDPADARRLADRIRLHNNRIRIPETLLISAIGIVDDVSTCATMDAKPVADSSFYFVGLQAAAWPEADIRQAAALHRKVAELIRGGAVLAAHDCGDEGVLLALAEMAFAGKCGVEATFSDPAPLAPIPCGYVLQVAADQAKKATALASQLAGVRVVPIGRATAGDKFTWRESDAKGAERFEVDLDKLADAWRSPLNW